MLSASFISTNAVSPESSTPTPCTDGQKNYPDTAIPKDRYDNLKAIAEGRTRIKAVDEWNLLVKEYKRNKTKRKRGR